MSPDIIRRIDPRINMRLRYEVFLAAEAARILSEKRRRGYIDLTHPART